MQGAWSVRVLGGFEVTHGERRLQPPSGVPLEATKLLATCGPLHVEEVTEVLWPGSSPSVGRRRLRNVLLRVREAYGPVVERHEDVVALAPGARVDARAFTEAAQGALLRPRDDPEAVCLARTALDAHGGELLPADRYREWTVQPRQRLQELLLGVLDLLAGHAVATGGVHEAVWLLQYAIQIDPWAEDRYLTAARLLHERGLHGRAATLLARARAVADDLGLPPPEAPWAASWNLPAVADPEA